MIVVWAWPCGSKIVCVQLSLEKERPRQGEEDVMDVMDVRYTHARRVRAGSLGPRRAKGLDVFVDWTGSA